MTQRDEFTAAEWDTLQSAVIASFFFVAAVDGKVDEKEATAFARVLAGAHAFRNALARDVCDCLGNGLGSMLAKFRLEAEASAECLRQTAAILDQKVSSEESRAFKAAILGIMREVADASGGFFGLGSRISANEKKAIVVVASLLRFA